ncbi:CBL-interacting serine/threonine-protein kinase 1-like isoform X2 [Andrographis paniculata]|uniref:CBL-interacting serine/threonine-protein kinase 1-like isoform X2 n=1 Tax=Andrographis paniculata TaxID=175694 RepID=UPI0021E8A384|nr:CBL-interacting serine/threonine-protein kinase 1-like isoform X2 [Andrographis paniculata]
MVLLHSRGGGGGGQGGALKLDDRKQADVVAEKGMRLGKYELGRTLGEGNFGKVKLARNLESGEPFAIKILEKNRIIDLKIADQVLASKTKIFMVLEYVDGSELFERIACKGKFAEAKGRKLFQQLIDGVSYCHNKGVFHRDLKLENVLIDTHGNIKITDFGLSALPQHVRDDGLFHTTCGSPNYVAPEILSNRGYDGATSDTWSCGVILYVILTGYLPFDDRNLAVLYQKIFKGDVQIPKWLSLEAKDLIKRILDPNPHTRITMAEIKENEWFKREYVRLDPGKEEEEEDNNNDDNREEDSDNGANTDDEVSSVHETPSDADKEQHSSTLINAFQLIGMSSCLDLSGFFEKENVSERKIRFTSKHSPKQLQETIEDTAKQMGLNVQRKKGKLKVIQPCKGLNVLGWLSVFTEIFEISPSLCVVELQKVRGDPVAYKQLCNKVSNELGVAAGSFNQAAEF